MALLVLVEAAIHETWGDVGPAILLGLAMMALTAGFGAFISVWIPQNRVEAPRESGVSILATGIEGVVALIVFPTVMLATSVFEAVVDAAVVAAGFLVVFVLIGWALTRISAGWLARNPFRVADLLSP